MNTETLIIVKIFIGYIENGEIKMHLNQSALWKEEKLVQSNTLVKTQFQSREYIGKFIESSLTYKQVMENEQEIRQQLKLYCPKLDIEKHVAYIFPQIFLA